MFGWMAMNPTSNTCTKCNMLPIQADGLCVGCLRERSLSEPAQGALSFGIGGCRWCHDTKVYQSIFPGSPKEKCKECS